MLLEVFIAELKFKIFSKNLMVSKLSMTTDDRNGNKGEMTPLMEAAYNGFTDIVTLLIDLESYNSIFPRDRNICLW